MMLKISKIASDRKGGVAVTFAFVIGFLLLCAGIALDYAVAVSNKRIADQALDQALLAATVAAAKAKENGRADWMALGTKLANDTFKANLQSRQNFKLLNFNPVISFANNSVSATATYDAQSPTTFMKLFQKSFIEYDGSTRAVVGLPSYVDVHFVIDGSASMGIGAQLADQLKMYGSKTKCSFACHQKFDAVDYSPAVAHAAGAKLRIDVIREAILAVVSSIKAKKPKAGSVRIALHLFSTTLTAIIPLSSDLDAVLNAAGGIDLMKGSEGGSYVSYALRSLAGSLAPAGDGSSPSTRASYVVLLSDGIDDSATSKYNASSKLYGIDYARDMTKWYTTSPSKQVPNSDPSYLQPFDVFGCTSLKGKGHRVLTVQIQYILGHGLRDWPDKAKVAHIQGEMATPLANAFKGCSSKPATDYVVAKDSATIGPVLSQIVSEVVLPQIVRLAE